jgi:hypothetical protein
MDLDGSYCAAGGIAMIGRAEMPKKAITASPHVLVEGRVSGQTDHPR